MIPVVCGSFFSLALQLDASDGALRWTYHSTAGLFSSLAVAHGVVYAAAGSVSYALDARSGTVIWQSTDPNGYVIHFVLHSQRFGLLRR
jgi:outer membrane protein assembly factor BamB